jgi:DNA-directed RNA polymerase subunit RPC12/RpoP
VTLKDIIRCPQCGGAEIVYSCEPKCCFNHVCADCRTTFEINTQKTGRFDRTTPTDAVEPGSSDPTTACANCESLRLAVLTSTPEKTLLLCADCRAISRMVIEEVVAGNL